MSQLLKSFTLFLLLSLITCNEPVIVQELEPLNLYYSSLTVCDCYQSAMSVIGNLIEYEDEAYKMLFQELRMNCLTKYGSQLFIPTECNYPDSLQMLMDSLYVLGIDLNS